MILTGGVVFHFLTKRKARSVAAKDKVQGVKSGNTEPQMMEALVEAVAAGSETNLNSLKSNTSGYKHCEINGTQNIPFDDRDVIGNYRDLVENNYDRAVKQMKKFSDNYISEKKDKRDLLVSDLVTAVKLDETIRNELFYVQPSGKAIHKQELIQIGEVPLETLLVGIMYFVLTERNGCNEDGKEMLSYVQSSEYNRLHVKCVPLVEETIKEKQPEPAEERKSGKLPLGKKMVENMNAGLKILADATTKTGVDRESVLKTGQVLADAFDDMFEKDDESENTEDETVKPEVVEVVEPMKDDKGNVFNNYGSGPQIGTINGDFNYYNPGGDKDDK